MSPLIATARSCANIALIKYWGNRDDALHLPSSGSISMNLDGLTTTTTVRFDESLAADRLTINGQSASGPALERVSQHLGRIRELAGLRAHADVVSDNTFPVGVGLASSASAFAALTLAACAAAGLTLPERELTTLARLGSGSACRSVPTGFVEWLPGHDHASSYAESIAPPDHWGLVDLIAIISQAHKPVGSLQGHRLATTSPFQAARLADAPRRLDLCRSALLARDFETLAGIVEQDALMMHAVMLTSTPLLVYLLPATLHVIQTAHAWRAEGYPVFFTIDAGPNVHLITLAEHADVLERTLAALGCVRQVLRASPGGPAHLQSS
jgi:diphosphomevalonate decarboxylase